ncbi:VOC family protein [Paenibacillus sp. SC116]|uniref:VOC family protein n=1 Tax=Paenibacillus sp. SC116 TaxID=2968986 RepID=UPI00215B3F16|nr:VOC family protein [Paenibacillus sp. SC116]MCR8845388.1 VOC family protein [Paenibacillus sp. SC116]
MFKLCVISIYVSDIELAKEFYCEKLGFTISEQYDEATIGLVNDGVAIVLCKTECESTASYSQEAQVVLGFETDNLLNKMQELSAKGIKMLFDTPQPCPPGHYNAFLDPFGNAFELLEFSK